VVGSETALLAGTDGAVPRLSALLGGEDANHLCTGCPRSGAPWSLLGFDLSPTVSHCHILRNLGVGMELTGAMEVAFANCIFAASSYCLVVSGRKRAAWSVLPAPIGQIPTVWDKCRC